MTIIDKTKDLISDGEIKEASKDISEDIFGALLGDYVSIGKIMKALAMSPFFLREKYFG